MRALFEFLLLNAVAFVARAILTSILRGIAQASARAAQGQASSDASSNQGPANKRWTEPPPAAGLGGDLHKDPVCGTYVAERAGLKRQYGGQTFYYCSPECLEKHALVAR